MFSRSLTLETSYFALYFLSLYLFWWCLYTLVDAFMDFVGFFVAVVGMFEQTGTGQTATHTYSHQYAPATHNYGGYAINPEYVVNNAVPTQEVRCSSV